MWASTTQFILIFDCPADKTWRLWPYDLESWDVDSLIAVVLLWQVQPKHLPCIGVCCLHIAAKMVEEESNISLTQDLIRISQSKFTVSDLCRMEKIISEKLSVEPKAVTALTFLQLYYSAFISLSAGR